MLKVGDPAPALAVRDETGTPRTLAEFRGRTLVLWFYPKASTPGCTIEGCGFRDRIREYEALGVAIVGVSFDAPAENKAFRDAQRFPYPLLCDEDRALGLALGACTDRSAKHPERRTVVIDPEGRIARILPAVNAKTHVDELLEALGGKPAPKRGGFFRRLFGG